MLLRIDDVDRTANKLSFYILLLSATTCDRRNFKETVNVQKPLKIIIILTTEKDNSVQGPQFYVWIFYVK